MTAKKKNKGNLFAKLAVGAAFGAAAIFLLKNDKLQPKDSKDVSTNTQEDRLFI